jgi:hypothetical protein
MPLRDERFLEIGYFAKNPKSPQSREREQVQCLGDMPLAEPGDCNVAQRILCGRCSGNIQERRGEQLRHLALAAAKRRATVSKEKASPP